MATVVVGRPGSTTTPQLSSSNSSDTTNKNEGDELLIKEILSELDRERRRRAELEAKVRQLLTEQKRDKASKQLRDDEMIISRKHFIALQTEMEGYRRLVEVITSRGRPAVAAAMKSNLRQRIMHQKQHYQQQPMPMAISTTPQPQPTPPSLPLHVIRLLEVMPWDPRANAYAFATETMYEWQFYNLKQKQWLSEFRQSPSLFRALPTEEPKPGVNAGGSASHPPKRKLSLPFFVDTMPSQSGVLTNHAITKLYDLQKGYPLPENGGSWQWVGGWRVEKRVDLSYDFAQNGHNGTSTTNANGNMNGSRRHPRVDCDDEGWSYAMDATHFLLNPTETCWDHAGTTTEGNNVLRLIRRRKWTRQRSLIDYPYASESTRCFLGLMAQRKTATMAANKISEQLVETKVSLTEAESAVMQCKDEVARQVRSLKQVLGANRKKKISPKETKQALQEASEAAGNMQIQVLEILNTVTQGREASLSL